MTVRALQLTDLGYAYPDGHAALHGVDLALEPGERVALLGPNGAGKTTLALHLAGLLGDLDGSVEIAGRPLTKASLKAARAEVGLVFQDPDDQLFSATVFADVAFGPKNYGLRGEELDRRVREALAAVGMEEHAQRPPHHLSFGQRRRVAVATVLAMRPSILVLDEPSSNLDPTARRELAQVLAGLDVAMLLITHDLPYALELCPRAVILDGGRIVADGPIRELLGDTDLMAAHRLELPYGFVLA